ncbi:MAG: hypothetical protein IPP63_13840 [Chloracidobacterium sp.]|nr:hypothetical protein [Chloracidobacterium sp.]
MREAVAAARAAKAQITSLDDKLTRMRDGYKATSELLKESEARSVAATGLVKLEEQNTKLLYDIAASRAALERDERFQQEIKSGLCPILSEKCLNLKEGETLESFVSGQFVELRSRIARVETERDRCHVAKAPAASRRSFDYR